MKQRTLVLSWAVMFSTLLGSLPTTSIAQQPVTKNLRYGDMTGTVSGQKKKGFEPRGPLTMRYVNGKDALRGQFTTGLPDGIWQRWYPNGQRFGKYTYRLGVLDGVVAQYWDDGSLARFGHYSLGIPTGQLLFFARDGRLTKRMFLPGKRKKYLAATRYRFVCTVRKGVARCKPIDDIRRDLGTILSSDQVEELLAGIDSLYDNLGFDETADALISCAEGRLTAKRSGQDLPTAASSGEPKMGGLKGSAFTTSIFGGSTTRQSGAALRNLASSSCTKNSRGSLVGGAGLPGRTDPGQRNAIDRAVQRMDASAQQCHTSSMVGLVGQAAPIVETSEPLLSSVLKSVLESGGSVIGEKLAGTAFDFLLDDGYATKGSPMGRGRTKYVHTADSTGYKIVDENNKTRTLHSENADGSTDVTVYDGPNNSVKDTWTERYKDGRVENGTEYKEPILDGSGYFIHKKWTVTDSNGNVVEQGTVRSVPKTEQIPGSSTPQITPGEPEEVVEKKNPDGSTTTTVSKNGKKTKETTKDANGNVTSDQKFDPNGNPIKDSGGNTGASMPADPNAGSLCQQAQRAWQQFKATCDAAGWQTYKCQKFVAAMNGCPDPAIILTNPEGDVICSTTSDSDRELAVKAACERKKGIMIPSGDSSVRNVCDKPDLNAQRNPGMQDVCNDPRGMCRPDAMVGLDEVSREGPQP